MFRLRITQLAATLLLGTLMVVQAVAQPQETVTWATVAPQGEGFSIRMPVKPEEESDRTLFEGSTYLMRMYTSADRFTGVLYMVLMQEFSSAAGALESKKRFDSFMVGFKEGMSKTLGSESAPLDLKAEQDLNLKGTFGRQYALSFGSTRGSIRAYDRTNRIYVLVAVGGNEGNESNKRFFDSLEFMPAPAPVPRPITDKSSSANKA